MVTITVTCYSWAPSSGDHLFTCGAIVWPPQLPIVGSWHVNLVLFWWWTDSTALFGLTVHVLHKMLWPLTTSVRTTRSKPFLAKPEFKKLQLRKEKHKIHHVLDKMLWPFTTSAHTTRCRPFLAPISFLWRRMRRAFSCLFLNENHELRAKLVCIVRACTRLIYSRAGFGQRLLARPTGELTCTNFFCPNWLRLP